MKGFVARHQQAVAIIASAAVLLAVGAALVGVILAGRHTATTTAIRPTPSPTFDTGLPTPGASDTPSPSASGTATSTTPSPAATASAAPAGGPTAAAVAPTNIPCGTVIACPKSPSAAATVTPLPAPNVGFSNAQTPEAYNLAFDGSTGDVWFTSPSANKLGKLSGSSITLKDTTVSGAAPHAIAADPADGGLWVTLGGNNPAIAHFDSTGTLKHVFPVATASGNTDFPFPVASAGVPSESLVVDGSMVWFTMPGRYIPTIGRLDPSQSDANAVTEFKLNGCGNTTHHPFGLAQTADRVLWMGTSSGNGQSTPYFGAGTNGGIARFTPGSNSCADFSNVGPVQSVGVGPDGNMWFANTQGVGTFSSGSPQIKIRTNLVGTGTSPMSHLGLVTAKDPSQGAGAKAIWVTYDGSDSGLARAAGSQGKTYSHDAGQGARSIATDGNGRIFYTENGNIVIATVS